MVLKKIVHCFLNNKANIEDSFFCFYKRTAEKIKFLDKRRKSIYRAVEIDKNTREEIESFYKKNYGKRIPLIWHRYYAAYTGKIDTTYFPELLFVPELEHFLNSNTSFVDSLADKNFLPLIAKASGITMPKIYFSKVCGKWRDDSLNPIDQENVISEMWNIGESFLKPSIDSDSGRGCMKLRIVDGIDIISGKSIKTIIENSGNNVCIQECVRCHESISSIYPNSVNTFRIMTYLWNGEVYSCPAVMRIGRGGGYLDNAHAGGIFIGIDDEGNLKEKAFTEFKDVFLEHPDTKVIFSNVKICLFPKVLKQAKKMHKSIEQLGCINWDFTINENGEPVLIEANTKNGGIWIFQMAHGCGPFADNTKDILNWMRIMKKKSLTKRLNCSFKDNEVFYD